MNEFRWPDENKGPWMIRLLWSEVGGRQECVGFSVEPLAGNGHAAEQIITRERVRAIPIGTFIREARRAPADGTSSSPEQNVTFKRRPRMWGREHYHKVANVYYRAWCDGKPPVQAVVQYFTNVENFKVSHATAARWVREARERQILSKAPERGVAGGLPRWIDTDPKETREDAPTVEERRETE